MKKQIGVFLLGILARMARGIVNKYSPKIVAVTGTVGKTTTKEAIYTVLAPYFDTAKSNQNANSEWGVVVSVVDPGFDSFTYTNSGKAKLGLGQMLRLVVLGMFKNLFTVKYPRVLVLELGIDKAGDMEWFNRWFKYDVAVVTNIGHTHQEFFNSFEDLIAEKLTIFKGLKDYGLAIVNDENSKRLGDSYRKVVFGDNGEIKGTSIGDLAKINFDSEGFEVTLPGGRQFLPAMLIATAVAREFALTGEQIKSALFNLKTIEGRFTLHRLGGITLIDDAYNASPDSMRIAIDSLEDIPGRKVVVLGEMKELGSFDAQGHQEIGEYVANKVDRLFAADRGGRLIGEAALAKGMSKDKVTIFDDMDIEKMGAGILNELRDNDVILIKASRSVGLDRLVKYLLTHLNGRVSS